MKKETKAQKAERIKSEKDGLDVLSNLMLYAKKNIDIDPEDVERFKWYGIYPQSKNTQGNDTDDYYMLRIKVEKGFLTTEQLSTVANISKEFSRNTADITTRQDIQLHWISLKDIPTIFARLQAVGLNTIEACGDCPRNIVSCPINGSDFEQIDDLRDIVGALNDLYRSNHDFSNLPRKFKIGVCGCSKHCMNYEIQDLSFTAIKNYSGKLLFSVAVGGGLASNKRIASHIGYIKREDIVLIAKTVVQLFRDHGNRENRSKARLGFLLYTWGLEKFSKELQAESGITFVQSDTINFTPYPKRTHFGIIKTLDKNLNNIGYAVTSGKIGNKIYSLANTLQLFGVRGISFTTTQNFIAMDVPKDKTEAFVRELKTTLGLSIYPSVFQSRTLACTGLNFCRLALSETKNFSIKLVEYLNKKFPDFDEPISISINGCPNSCSHPHIVDLGFVGAKIKRDGNTVVGFNLHVGGILKGEKSSFGIKTLIKVTQSEIPALVESLILEYQKSSYTNFRNFILEKYVNEYNI